MKNSIKVTENTFKEYGTPKQLMTDHGTQFISLPRKDCPNPEPNEFQKLLDRYNVKHIKARVKHPQSNGKNERLFQTIYAFKKHFGSWERAIEYYNYEIFHPSLWDGNGGYETPYEAYLRKMRKNGKKKKIS